jgi:hypothetical protein
MIFLTPYSVDQTLIKDAVASIGSFDHKQTLNVPSGDFFYDSWSLKEEFINTPWQKILDSIKEPIGEARIITLESGTNYYSHSDIDDRWHLSLDGNQSFLIDLEDKTMFETVQDGQWYFMNAGKLHTAANFGQVPRRQLVVRNLLKRNTLVDPITIEITKAEETFDYRYQFDHRISPWLNMANKRGYISNFSYSPDKVVLSIEKTKLDELVMLLEKSFRARTI